MTDSNFDPFKKKYTVLFHGNGSSLLLLMLKNLFLTLVTFGVYAAWGKTAKRKYLWQNIEVDGQRLLYTGTGKEIFNGYLKVLGIYLAFTVLSMFIHSIFPQAEIAFSVLTFILIFLLIPYITYLARRYLLSRTTYRGIRFGFSEGSRDYVIAFLKGYPLFILSLGLYYPFWTENVHRIALNQTFYGSKNFTYTGTGKDLFRSYLICCLLTPFTLGMVWCWYEAKAMEYRARHTFFDQAQGEMQVTGSELLGLFAKNVFLAFFTLGLATPWIIASNFRFFASRMTFSGFIDFGTIRQRESFGDATADDLANILDLPVGI